jgi:hypothetical protein
MVDQTIAELAPIIENGQRVWRWAALEQLSL